MPLGGPGLAGGPGFVGAPATTSVMTVAVLLALLGSDVLARTVAVLLMVAPGSAVTLTTILTVALARLAKLPRLQVNVPVLAPAAGVVQFP